SRVRWKLATSRSPSTPRMRTSSPPRGAAPALVSSRGTAAASTKGSGGPGDLEGAGDGARASAPRHRYAVGNEEEPARPGLAAARAWMEQRALQIGPHELDPRAPRLALGVRDEAHQRAGQRPVGRQIGERGARVLRGVGDAA